jgi:mannose-1-phosphate guanylyltransferase
LIVIHQDPTAKIGTGCVLGPNVVVGPNCVIEDGVRMHNSVLLEGVRIGSNSCIAHSIFGWKTKVGKWVRTQSVTVTGEGVVIKDELFVNGAKILPHKEVDTSIPEEGSVIL